MKVGGKEFPPNPPFFFGCFGARYAASWKMMPRV